MTLDDMLKRYDELADDSLRVDESVLLDILDDVDRVDAFVDTAAANLDRQREQVGREARAWIAEHGEATTIEIDGRRLR